MTINYTWPGRLHLIVGRYLYVTIWLFGRRYHALIGSTE